MNRRRFLKWLGVGSAVVAAAPSIVSLMEPACATIDPLLNVVVLDKAVIGEYVDYVNFSNFVIASSIDESVDNAAKQLGESYNDYIATLHAQVFV